MLLAAAGVTAAVPWTLAQGSAQAGSWQVQVTPGVLAPSFESHHDDETAGSRGLRWPGGLQAEEHAFTDALTGERSVTVVVGSAPLAADSVRLTTLERGVREASVRVVGWHRVHVEVFEGPVTITEVAAIGSGGEVLQVLEDLQGMAELQGRPDLAGMARLEGPARLEVAAGAGSG